MLKFNERVEQLKSEYEEQHNTAKHCGNDFQMWMAEGSIDLCNDVLNSRHRTKENMLHFLKVLEWEAHERGLQQTKVMNICYDGGREAAVAPLRKIAEETLD